MKSTDQQLLAEYLRSGKNSGNMSNYHQLARQYSDNVNQPTGSDAFADAFTRAGSGQAIGPAQQESNALLLGIGAGFKSHANNQRNSKLQSIQDQTAKLLELDAHLQQQMYEQEGLKLKTTQFFRQNAVPIAELSKASMAGDTSATEKLAQNILRNYKTTFQDSSVGDFDHYNNGVIYYEDPQTGDIVGKNVMNVIYQSGINPVEIWGQDASVIEAGLSPGAKLNYENTRQMQQLQLQGMQADNTEKAAKANLYNTQASAAKNEIENPAWTPDQNKTAEFNRNLIRDTLEPQIKANEGVVGVYDALEDILKNNPKLVGSDTQAKTRRAFATYFGLSDAIDYAKLKSVEFEKMLKPILGAQLGEKEGERVLSKFVSLDQHPAALKKFITEDKQQKLQEIVKSRLQIESFNNKAYNNLFDNGLYRDLDSHIKNYTDQRQSQKVKSGSNTEPNNSIEPFKHMLYKR